MTVTTDFYSRALAALEAGSPHRAEQLLLQLVQGDPADARAVLTLGQALRQQGRAPEAVARYEQVLQFQPENPDALYQLAVTCRELGQFERAEQIYGQLLERYPDHAEGLTGLGAILAEQGRLDAALPRLARAVQVRPDFAQARLNLGVGLGMVGRWREARAELEAALRLRPDYPEAWYNLGNILGLLNFPAEAAAAYRRALELRPDHSRALSNLAILLQQDGRPAEAVALLRRAVELQPSSPEAYNNLGLALQRSRRPGEATVMFRQSLRLRPRYAEALNNLGQSLFNLGRFRAAERCLLDALAEQPANARMHANLGAVLQAAGRDAEALGCFELALRFDPQCADAHYNRAMSLLSRGLWLEGWPDYEHRFALEGQVERPHTRPRWNGEDLAGKTILVWGEQGLGDMIHFVRYATVLHEQGARVVLECPPQVVPLFRGVPGVDLVITEGDRVPEYDVHAPLLSLPGLVGTTLRSAPAGVPYLEAPAERVEHWRRRLGAQASAHTEPRFRVGIAWRGSPRHAHDQWRSVPLEYFAPLAAVPGVQLISLQRGPGSEEIAALDGQFAVWQAGDDEAADDAAVLSDTAALMSCLDLVVSVDTAMAHLAGALALPVWLALSALPDWRWLRRGRHTPWYPTMRLYRQRRLGRWRKVFARMARQLREQVSHNL